LNHEIKNIFILPDTEIKIKIKKWKPEPILKNSVKSKSHMSKKLKLNHMKRKSNIFISTMFACSLIFLTLSCNNTKKEWEEA